MYIEMVDPANMRGCAGRKIQSLDNYWKKRNGIFTRGVPSFRSQLWYDCVADGSTLPDITYLGDGAFINEIMRGQFGSDFATSVNHYDPRFVTAVSEAFPQAAEGFPVTDRVQMEVTPPGFGRPLFVDYYRYIRRFTLPFAGHSVDLLSVLVVPTDEWRAGLEGFIDSAVDLLDRLDSPTEGFEPDEDIEDYHDGVEAEETVDGYSA